jgi:hypothetical protein
MSLAVTTTTLFSEHFNDQRTSQPHVSLTTTSTDPLGFASFSVTVGDRTIVVDLRTACLLRAPLFAVFAGLKSSSKSMGRFVFFARISLELITALKNVKQQTTKQTHRVSSDPLRGAVSMNPPSDSQTD